MSFLHIFNPQHELALAANSATYSAPASAMRFASDCATLPLWYANSGDSVFTDPIPHLWKEIIDYKFPQLQTINLIDKIDSYTELRPWGVDAAILRNTTTQTELVHNLSNRIHTIDAMNYLRNNVDILMASNPIALYTLDETLSFTQCHQQWVLKSPISGSGRGVFMGDGIPSQAICNWITKTIKQFGFLMGEPKYKKICDFAMEFEINRKECKFKGYSLFDTNSAGVYSGNILASNTTIETRLSKLININILNKVKGTIISYLEQNFHLYDGPIGVDMMIYKDDADRIRINPMVEINVRMTMGYVTRIFFDRFVHPDSNGVFRIEHKTHPKDSAIIKNGRIIEGVQILCPNTSAEYSVIVEIKR